VVLGLSIGCFGELSAGSGGACTTIERSRAVSYVDRHAFEKHDVPISFFFFG